MSVQADGHVDTADEETASKHIRNAQMIIRGCSGNRNREEVAAMLEAVDERLTKALGQIEGALALAGVCEHHGASMSLHQTGGTFADDHSTGYWWCGQCHTYFVRTLFDSNREDDTRPMTQQEIKRFAK